MGEAASSTFSLGGNLAFPLVAQVFVDASVQGGPGFTDEGRFTVQCAVLQLAGPKSAQHQLFKGLVNGLIYDGGDAVGGESPS